MAPSLANERVPRRFVYYESLKRTLKTKTIYGYRYDERLKTNVEESTRLTCTPLCAELEHLKIETRLTSETPVSEMGEYASVVYYESLKSVIEGNRSFKVFLYSNGASTLRKTKHLIHFRVSEPPLCGRFASSLVRTAQSRLRRLLGMALTPE